MSLRERIKLLNEVAMGLTTDDKLVGSIALDTLVKNIMTHYNSILKKKVDKSEIESLNKEDVTQIIKEIWEA